MTRYLSHGEAEAICASVAAQHGLTLDQVLTTERRGAFVAARWEAMRIMRERGASYPMIGKRMQMHHTSVMHALGALGRQSVART